MNSITHTRRCLKNQFFVPSILLMLLMCVSPAKASEKSNFVISDQTMSNLINLYNESKEFKNDLTAMLPSSKDIKERFDATRDCYIETTKIYAQISAIYTMLSIEAQHRNNFNLENKAAIYIIREYIAGEEDYNSNNVRKQVNNLLGLVEDNVAISNFQKTKDMLSKSSAIYKQMMREIDDVIQQIETNKEFSEKD